MRTVYYIKSRSIHPFQHGKRYTDRDKWLESIQWLMTKLTGKQAFSYWTEQECESCFSEFDAWDGVRETIMSEGNVVHEHQVADVCPECGQRVTHILMRYESAWNEHFLVNPDHKEM